MKLYRLTVKGAESEAITAAEAHGCQSIKVITEFGGTTQFLDALANQTDLVKWFVEGGEPFGKTTEYPAGTLLHYSDFIDQNKYK